MKKISLKTVIATAIAIATMCISVSAAVPSFGNIYLEGDDKWTSGAYQFTTEKEHTVMPTFQYVHYKGNLTFQITYKVAGFHMVDADANLYVTNRYGGIQASICLDGTVEKNADRYYRIFSKTAQYSEDDVKVKIASYKDTVNSK